MLASPCPFVWLQRCLTLLTYRPHCPRVICDTSRTGLTNGSWKGPVPCPSPLPSGRLLSVALFMPSITSADELCLSGQQSHFLLEVASAGRAGGRDGCHSPWVRPICLNKPRALSSRNTCFCWFSLRLVSWTSSRGHPFLSSLEQGSASGDLSYTDGR